MIIKKEIQTTNHEELISITDVINNEISKLNVKEGNAIIYIPHTTAGITINENADPSVKRDILTGLKSLKFESINFTHAEGNSPSHIKSSLFGNSINVIISDNRMMLGTWQGVYFCEFDGPRKRTIILQVQKFE